jgi:hypothetical protein
MPDDTQVGHLPDPAQRYQVLAFTRGAKVSVEILDDVRKTGVAMDLLSALRVAADINLEALRIMEVLGTQLEESLGTSFEQGTLPVWKRLIAEWGSHGEGTAEQN